MCGLFLFTEYNNNNVIGRVSINVYLSQMKSFFKIFSMLPFLQNNLLFIPSKVNVRFSWNISNFHHNKESMFTARFLKKIVYSPYPSNCLISIPTFNSLVSNVTSSHLQQDLDLWPIAYIYSKQFQRWNIPNHKWNEIFSWLLLRKNWGEKNKQGI